MGISMDPLRSGPGTALSGGVRVLSEADQEEQRRRQDLERRNAKLHTPDKDAFFLEYFKYRGKKVSQSVTKLAKVMAESKADDLSKNISEENPKQQENALEAVAKKLGVSPEALTITVEQAGGDTAQFSGAIKELAAMASRKSIEERYEGKMLSEKESEEAKEPGWAETLRAKAASLEAAASGLRDGAVTTGTPPDGEAMRKQAEVFRAVADLVERTEKAAPGLTEEKAAALKEIYDVTDLPPEKLPALLEELERLGAITPEERESAQRMPLYTGIVKSGGNTRFSGGNLLDNLRERIAAEDAQRSALMNPATLFTGDRDSQRDQIDRMQARHRNLLAVLERLV